jgi:hypothetical protein
MKLRISPTVKAEVVAVRTALTSTSLLVLKPPESQCLGLPDWFRDFAVRMTNMSVPASDHTREGQR